MVQDVSVTVLVANGFVPTELALVQDILRIASRLNQSLHFVPQVCSIGDEELLEGLGGMMVRAVPFRMDENRPPDHLVVLGGRGTHDGFTKIRARLRWIERMGGSILLLSDAASEWKRLYPENDRVTTHWEPQQLDRDAGVALDDALPLFSQTNRITTAAGMMSTADVVLNQIVAPRSLRLAQAVCKVLLMDCIREGDACQPRSENDVPALRLAGLEPAIAAMDQNLEDPLTVTELAAVAGFSPRQLERKFKTAVGQSPAAFYRSLRLRRARTLIEQTVLSISEISVACGLGSPSCFSKIFAREFGISPARRRAQLSARATQPQLNSHS